MAKVARSLVVAAEGSARPINPALAALLRVNDAKREAAATRAALSAFVGGIADATATAWTLYCDAVAAERRAKRDDGLPIADDVLASSFVAYADAIRTWRGANKSRPDADYVPYANVYHAASPCYFSPDGRNVRASTLHAIGHVRRAERLSDSSGHVAGTETSNAAATWLVLRVERPDATCESDTLATVYAAHVDRDALEAVLSSLLIRAGFDNPADMAGPMPATVRVYNGFDSFGKPDWIVWNVAREAARREAATRTPLWIRRRAADATVAKLEARRDDMPATWTRDAVAKLDAKLASARADVASLDRLLLSSFRVASRDATVAAYDPMTCDAPVPSAKPSAHVASLSTLAAIKRTRIRAAIAMEAFARCFGPVPMADADVAVALATVQTLTDATMRDAFRAESDAVAESRAKLESARIGTTLWRNVASAMATWHALDGRNVDGPASLLTDRPAPRLIRPDAEHSATSHVLGLRAPSPSVVRCIERARVRTAVAAVPAMLRFRPF